MTAEQIIKNFNATTDRCLRYTKWNTDIVERLQAKYSDSEILMAIPMFAEFAEENGMETSLENFEASIGMFVDDRKFQKSTIVDAEVPQNVGTAEMASAMLVLQGAVQAMTEKVGVDAIRDKAYEMVDDYIRDQYGPIRRTTELKLNGVKKELEGVTHKKFETILSFVYANEPVFLTGRAGTGKNYLCKQVAKALDLDFYFSNAVTQEYKITGFTDANGVYQESQFYKAFKNGGLFMLDEMDASIPEVLVILNAAIANRYFDFPAPIGYVEAHEDFRVVAAGNTFGLGADFNYVGRNQLDAASLDRFALVEIDYDERIEEACAGGDEDWLRFCRAFRDATEKAGIRTVVSYRAISRGHEMSEMLSKVELLKTCLVKSLSANDLKNLEDDVLRNRCGAYSEAYKELVRG